MLDAQQTAELRDAKQALADSDYKLIKCLEAHLLNQPLPYDIVLVVAERNILREVIRSLEE